MHSVHGHPLTGSGAEVAAVVPVVLEETLRELGWKFRGAAGSSGKAADSFIPLSPRAHSSGSDPFGSTLHIFGLER